MLLRHFHRLLGLFPRVPRLLQRLFKFFHRLPRLFPRMFGLFFTCLDFLIGCLTFFK
jgi:hypothetical protein